MSNSRLVALFIHSYQFVLRVAFDVYINFETLCFLVCTDFHGGKVGAEGDIVCSDKDSDSVIHAGNSSCIHVGTVVDLVNHFELFAGSSGICCEHFKRNDSTVAFHNHKSTVAVRIVLKTAVHSIKILGELNTHRSTTVDELGV